MNYTHIHTFLYQDYFIRFNFKTKKDFSSFRVLIPLILNSFDSIYDPDLPESQFHRSHQTTRKSQQTVTFICELSQIFANQHRNYPGGPRSQILETICD